VRRLRRIWLACALLGAAIAAPAEVQKRTLLSSDGTLYTLTAGLASEVGVSAAPQDFVLAWSSTAQNGDKAGGLIPGTASTNPKTSLDLALDEPTGTLVVLWREESSVLNAIRVAFWKESSWTVVNLLPNNGFPHAYNPQMLLTHQTVHTLDQSGEDVYGNRSVLSVVWWEEAGSSQARYASFFLDEAIDATQAAVYDLPDLVDDSGPTTLAGLPRGAYAFPALQSAGPGGDVLASFATASSHKQYVVRISYATELGKPGKDNNTWLRRRIPVVGVASVGPISAVPSMDMASMHTVIGSSYRPTLYWSDGGALHYIRFDGAAWSDVKSIEFSDDMTYDHAVALVEGMAARN
jgi:hypothetical protein